MSYSSHTIKTLCCLTILIAFSTTSKAEDSGGITYLGNEGLLFSHANQKVLFDPFFHNSYGSYQLVPDSIRDALFNDTPPYDGISAIFISHAHGDHFAANDLLRYLTKHPEVKLIAPKAAVEAIKNLKLDKSLDAQLITIDLNYRDAPIQRNLDAIEFDAVRIPHAGWPQRADVSNIVFRVSLNQHATIIHMGDADPDDEHFAPLKEHWDKKQSQAAFPPYWFFTTSSGRKILSQHLKAAENVGVHVPISVPADLKDSGARYFHTPGETLELNQ